ncbi:MAG: FAD-binding oxidoreductase [Bacillota bacterium]
MAETAGAVIIGGGIIGCATAYELAKLGMTDVVLLEKDYLTAGSTGRCGAGVRQQWGLEMNIRLSRGSVKILETLEEDLEYPYSIDLKQGGYLLLAFSDTQMRQFEKNVELQNSIGTPSRTVSVEEALEIVPHLKTDGLVGATFCQEDGYANPFHTTMAYARAARRLGVDVRTRSCATGIEVSGDRIVGVQTDRGYICTDVVYNAAGPFSAQVAAMAGVELPVYSDRHQFLVTEPVAPYQGPMVISFERGVICQQTPDGSFLVGLGHHPEPRGINYESSWSFLEAAANTVLSALPTLGELRMVRQWAGSYNMTPDAQPILGGVSGLEGYYMAVGFSGHGFMTGPMTARLMAQMMAGEDMEMDIGTLDLERFERGDLLQEPSVV